MSDEAKERGITIDIKGLSQKLRIDIVETTAITKEGIPRLKEAIIKTCALRPDLQLKKPLGGADSIHLLKMRGQAADALLEGVLSISKPLKKGISEKLGRMASGPISGVFILGLVLFVMYMFVGRFAAGTAVDFFEETVFGQYLNPFLINLTHKYIHIDIITDFLIGEYGIFTMALTYAFAIIFPIVTAFFLFFGFLEDSGYLPRLSVLSDKVFGLIGLNGRAILPMALGLGCGTMAILTTRILDSKKERIIVSLLLALAVPCSAQLGVIMGMLVSLSAKAFLVWLAVIVSVMIMTGLAASMVIPGERSPFIQEIPPIRMPQIGNIIVKTFARLKWYLKEAVPLFMLGTTILFAADKIGALKWIEGLLSPFVTGLLGLPSKAAEAFIIGFLRRDYGAAGLYMLSKAGSLDGIQTVVSLVVVTLFIPCIAQFFVTIKERGAKAACMIGAFVFISAFLIGYVLNITLRYLVFNLGIAVI